MQQSKPQRRRPRKKWPRSSTGDGARAGCAGSSCFYLDKGHGLHALRYLLLRKVVEVIGEWPGGAATATATAATGCPCRASCRDARCGQDKVDGLSQPAKPIGLDVLLVACSPFALSSLHTTNAPLVATDTCICAKAVGMLQRVISCIRPRNLHQS